MGAEEPAIPGSSDKQSGLDRISVIYEGGSVSLEKDLCKSVLGASFSAGFIIGGLMRNREAMSRFDMYSVGRIKGSSRNLARRKLDFGISMFVRNGLRSGMRMALLFTPVVIATTHITAYWDHFSLFTTPAFMIACGCAYAMPLGIRGMVGSFKISLLPSLVATIAPLSYSWYYELDSVDSAYRNFKNYYEEGIRKEKEIAKKVEKFKKDEGILFDFIAKHRLSKLERKSKADEEDENFSD